MSNKGKHFQICDHHRLIAKGDVAACPLPSEAHGDGWGGSYAREEGDTLR